MPRNAKHRSPKRKPSKNRRKQSNPLSRRRSPKPRLRSRRKSSRMDNFGDLANMLDATTPGWTPGYRSPITTLQEYVQNQLNPYYISIINLEKHDPDIQDDVISNYGATITLAYQREAVEHDIKIINSRFVARFANESLPPTPGTDAYYETLGALSSVSRRHYPPYYRAQSSGYRFSDPQNLKIGKQLAMIFARERSPHREQLTRARIAALQPYFNGDIYWDEDDVSETGIHFKILTEEDLTLKFNMYWHIEHPPDYMDQYQETCTISGESVHPEGWLSSYNTFMWSWDMNNVLRNIPEFKILLKMKAELG
jgi:hypothetical protein